MDDHIDRPGAESDSGSSPDERARLPALAFLLVGAALAIGLRLPLLDTPFFLDDLNQMGYLVDGDAQSYSFNSALDLYRFFEADPAEAADKMSRGDLPWRFDDAQRCAFFRPLSSGLMWLDHALFGTRSKPAHALSLAWFLLFALLLYGLYARLLPPGAAEIATLAAILSPASLMPVLWWSARGPLIAGAFTVLALIFHHRWREEGRARFLGFSLTALALGLLSCEIGVQAFGFLFAYAVVRSGGNWRVCLQQLSPALALLLVYLIASSALGYGVEGNALYVHPLREPGAYAAGVVSRFHLVLANAVLGEGASWLLAGAVLVVAAALAWRLVARSRAGASQALAWFLLAALLAMLLCFGGRSALRPWTLVIPQIGIHAVLGLLIASPWRTGDGRAWSTRAARAGSLFLFVVCVVLPARGNRTTLPAQQRAESSPEALARQFPAEVRAALTPRVRKLVILQGPIVVMPVGRLTNWHGVRGFEEDGFSTLVLAETGRLPLERSGLVVTRTAENTLRVRSDVPLVRGNDIYRFDRRNPYSVGTTVALDDVRVSVLQVDDNARPTALEYAFSRPLDGEEVVLVTWSNGRYELVDLPEVGQDADLR